MRNEDSTEWSIVANLNPPNAAQQANIHQLLLTARKVWLSDALRGAMADVDQTTLRNQVTAYVPVAAQRVLATAGIRDEAMFPLPVVLEARPSLVAYYRLLLGVSQKRFYKASTGMTPFKKLEQGAPLSEGLRTQLHDYCIAMCGAIAELVIQADSTLESRDVEDLQLLTLGSFYYGSLNNKIGQAATLGVFTAITEIVEPFVQSRSSTELALEMPDGRRFRIVVAGDPDMRIVESLDDTELPVVSIEIKGGTDKANAYNRGGEAEKSHQAAKQRGFEVCWTVIHTANVDIDKLYQGSPTTNAWFDTNEVIAHTGNDWQRFQNHMRITLGLEPYT